MGVCPIVARFGTQAAQDAFARHVKMQWGGWNNWAHIKSDPQTLSDATKYFSQDHATYEIEDLTD
eukprot:1553607-Alexandrium_andersonii.AAC.1